MCLNVASCACFSLLPCVSVPWQHYQPTKGVEGVRVDNDVRPELSMGSYEILNSQKVRFTFYNCEIRLHVSWHFLQYSNGKISNVKDTVVLDHWSPILLVFESYTYMCEERTNNC